MDSLDGAVGGDVTQRGEHASGTDGQNGGTQVADDELTAGFSHSKVGRGQRRRIARDIDTPGTAGSRSGI